MRKLTNVALPFFAVMGLASVVHAAPPGKESVQALSPAATVDFEVFLPLTNKASLNDLLKAQQTAGSASYHQWLTPERIQGAVRPKATQACRVCATR